MKESEPSSRKKSEAEPKIEGSTRYRVIVLSYLVLVGWTVIPPVHWLSATVCASGVQSFSAVRTRTQYVCGPIELSITDTTHIVAGPMETSCPYAGIGSWSSGSSMVCKTHPVRSTNLKTRATLTSFSSYSIHRRAQDA
jgi:hypothetical protein